MKDHRDVGSMLRAVRKTDKIDISAVSGRREGAELVERMHREGSWPEKHHALLYDDNAGVIWLFCIHDRDWVPLN